ncbi:MAG: hypothetical protein WDN72_04120 [Alphaproteobacteria bacterium]
MSLPAFAQESAPSGLSDDTVIEELHSCVLEAIHTNDDGKQDAKTVAANAVESCDGEAKAASKVATQGQDAAHYATFYAALKTGDYFVPAVTEERRIRADVDSTRAQFGAKAYDTAMERFKAANDAGKSDEADHWTRVAVRLKAGTSN